MTVSQDGKTALSEFKLKNRFKNSSLFEIEIKTGRTHQIRVHSSELGNPICGDSKYGDKQVNYDFRKIGLQRMFLHAYKVSFFYKKQFNFTAKIPNDLQQVLYNLKENIKEK